MSSDPEIRPVPFARSLSARVIVLTLIFVLIGEILIFAPSIGKARRDFLETRIAAAHLAFIGAAFTGNPTDDQKEILAEAAQVWSIRVAEPELGINPADLAGLPPDDRRGRVIDLGNFGEPSGERLIDATFDLREEGRIRGIYEGFSALWHRGQRYIRVVGESPIERGALVDIYLPETYLYRTLKSYGTRILILSLLLSMIVAAMFVVSLQWGVVGPLRRMTASIVAFRRQPEVALVDRAPSGRGDELGVVEREFAEMRREVRSALRQQARLAGLGRALGTINHDLRNILSTAVLLSDRLERSQDPAVRPVVPKLVDALDRAIRLCSDTLAFARDETPPLRPQSFILAELAEDVADAERGPNGLEVPISVEMPRDLVVRADRDQLLRVMQNLVRNGREAIGDGPGGVRMKAQLVDGQVRIDVEDDGAGVPDRMLPHLFEVFRTSGKAGGTGLGLATGREIARAHGGDVTLVSTRPGRTVFRIALPAPEGVRQPARQT